MRYFSANKISSTASIYRFQFETPADKLCLHETEILINCRSMNLANIAEVVYQDFREIPGGKFSDKLFFFFK